MTAVLDCSALVLAVADDTARGESVSAWLADDVVAPHLIDAEVGQALRGKVLRGELEASHAADALRDAHQFVNERFTHVALSERAWQLRDNLTFYDALYVALAELLHVPLVTADARLANATGPTCTIEVV
jgi:predicted nucleic acid-binding protein